MHPRRERPVAVAARPGRGEPSSSRDAFEQVYRDTVDVVIGYFARRCTTPQAVADLTAETFVRAMDSFAGSDPEVGSGPAWVPGIAKQVLVRNGDDGTEASVRPSSRRPLDPDETEELALGIAAERDPEALTLGNHDGRRRRRNRITNVSPGRVPG